MKYTDLRDFIAALEQRGELVRIQAEVDPRLEMTEIADRTLARAGAATETATLECGTGGGGAGEEFAAALQDHFAVGSDVDQQAGRFVVGHAAGQYPGGDVRADVGGDAG